MFLIILSQNFKILISERRRTFVSFALVSFTGVEDQ